MWLNWVGKSGSLSLNVSPLQVEGLNHMSFSKERILYQVGYRKNSLLVGCSPPMQKAGQTTIMVFNGFIISMLRHVFIFNLLMNIVFFFVTVTTAISRRTLSATVFNIALSLFFFHLILPTLCNHWMSASLVP